MISFIRSLFQGWFSRYHDLKISSFSIAKSALLTVLVPFVFGALFVPMVMAQEALIYSISIFLGDGLLSNFVNVFWSVHVNICISTIYAFKLTVYFNTLYSSLRKFQFQTMGKL